MTPRHPLEDENVLVSVTITHLTTGAIASGSVAAPADTAPSMSEALAEASAEATDNLLDQLEQRGG